MSKRHVRRGRHSASIARIVAVAFGALLSIACGSREPPETAPTPPHEARAEAAADQPMPAAERRIHTVQPGDTLWSLARRYGVSIGDFVAANDLADPDDLSVGERLVVPGAKAASPTGPAAARAATPTVPDGDAWVWPVAGGTVLSGFGVRRGDGVHRGVDIGAEPGETVVAAWSGVVVFAGEDMRNYGNAVIVDHGGGLTSLYGHNDALLVREGERVRRGQPIARAGDTGNATTVHCHFEVRRYAEALDPMDFLSAATR